MTQPTYPRVAQKQPVTQCDAILAHLQAGLTLTPADAFTRFGTLSMHSRAAELRGKGWPVICILQRIGNKNVGVYSLPESHIVRPMIDSQCELSLECSR